MTATRFSSFDRTLSTRIIKIDSRENSPWVVCTLDAVPIILASFGELAAAQKWQRQLGVRTRKAA